MGRDGRVTRSYTKVTHHNSPPSSMKPGLRQQRPKEVQWVGRTSNGTCTGSDSSGCSPSRISRLGHRRHPGVSYYTQTPKGTPSLFRCLDPRKLPTSPSFLRTVIRGPRTMGPWTLVGPVIGNSRVSDCHQLWRIPSLHKLTKVV